MDMTLTPDDLQAIQKLINESFAVFRKELYNDFADFIDTAITPQLDNHYHRLTGLERIHPLGTHS